MLEGCYSVTTIYNMCIGRAGTRIRLVCSLYAESWKMDQFLCRCQGELDMTCIISSEDPIDICTASCFGARGAKDLATRPDPLCQSKLEKWPRDIGLCDNERG